MAASLLTAAIGHSSRVHALFHALLNTFLNQKKAKADASERYLEMSNERQDAGELAWNFASGIRFETYPFAIRKIRLNEARRNIGYVSQEPFLL